MRVTGPLGPRTRGSLRPVDLAAFEPELRARVATAMAEREVPGVAVGVQLEGEQIAVCEGVTSVEQPLAVDERTLFQIGSTTKTFVATALMRKVEDGSLDLDTPLVHYLPGFALRKPEYGKRVTTRHLLSHTGGWMGDWFMFRPLPAGEQTLAGVVDYMTRAPIFAAPGELFSYNNAGFDVAARLLEVLCDRPFAQALRIEVLEPLELGHTFVLPEQIMTERFASGHIVFPDGPRVARPWALPRSSLGSGAITSDVCDQLTWARFHLGDGRAASGERVLRPETLAAMRAEQAPAGSICDHIGLPWLLRDLVGARSVGHGGATNGFLSAFEMVPERHFAVTVLTNADEGGPLHQELVAWIMERLLGVRTPRWEPIEPDAEQLRDAIGLYGSGYAALRPDGSGLVLQVQPMPDGKKSPKPVQLAFYAPDRLVRTHPPPAGARGELLRDAAGLVRFLRWGGRLLRRDPRTELSQWEPQRPL